MTDLKNKVEEAMRACEKKFDAKNEERTKCINSIKQLQSKLNLFNSELIGLNGEYQALIKLGGTPRDNGKAQSGAKEVPTAKAG